MMKFLIYSFLFLFLIGCNSAPNKETADNKSDSVEKDTVRLPGNPPPAQEDQPDNNSKEDPIIADIRKEYQRIQSANLVKKEVEYHANPGTEAEAVGVGGKVTWFYENGKIVKILDTGEEDHGTWKEEYFFKDGKIFFVYNNNTSGGVMNSRENKYERRIYIKDGKIYKQITTDNYGLKDFETTRLLKKAMGLYNARTSKDIANLYD